MEELKHEIEMHRSLGSGKRPVFKTLLHRLCRALIYAAASMIILISDPTQALDGADTVIPGERPTSPLMSLSVSKEEISNGLQCLQGIVSTNMSLPILANVLLEAKQSRLYLTATDLDIAITTSVEANVKQSGITTLPLQKLLVVTRKFSNSEMELETDNQNVTSLHSGVSFYKISGFGAAEFPPLPKLKENKGVLLPQEKLKAMLRKTSLAMSTDQSRYVLNGIFMASKAHKLTMVATDGRRLAFAETETNGAEANQGEFIIPAKAVNELNRLLQAKGEVEITFSENQATFNLLMEKGRNVLMTTKLIIGNYPNYRQVIPSEAKARVALSRNEVLHALRRAEFMGSKKQAIVKLILARNSLTIIPNSPEVGGARERLAINYTGKEMVISFNPRYLIEPLNALAEEEVYLELTDELSPATIKIDGPYLCVIMPMRPK